MNDSAPGVAGTDSVSSVQSVTAEADDSGEAVATEDAAAAINAFQEQALESMPEELMPHLREFAEGAIRDREHLHARRLTCRACFERIDGTLSAEERESLILSGSIDELGEHSGECWEIMSFGGFGNSIEGYLDAETGRLLVLWIAPEG